MSNYLIQTFTPGILIAGMMFLGGKTIWLTRKLEPDGELRFRAKRDANTRQMDYKQFRQLKEAGLDNPYEIPKKYNYDAFVEAKTTLMARAYARNPKYSDMTREQIKERMTILKEVD